MMKQYVLVIQGGGEGAYDEDGRLAADLQQALGAAYDVRYPRMPNEEAPEYKLWKARIAEELATFDGKAMIVGHSLGGSIVLKYLTEEQIDTPIAGLFLLAAPYWNGGDADWQYDGFVLREGFASKLSNIPRICLYHSRDDDTVPFTHLALYAEKLPQATICEFDDRGHQFKSALSEVAADITNG
ncbi:MAG: alpha/beta hydrolase [Roseiflexaceae bacterium]